LRVIGFGIGIIPLVLAGMIMLKNKDSMNRMDSKVGILTCIAGVIQCVRAFDPMGMNGTIHYTVSLTLLCALSTIAANAQIGALSGYVQILGGITPQNKDKYQMMLNLSHGIFVVKLIGDVLQPLLTHFYPKYLYGFIILNVLLSMSVFLLHPLACMSMADKVAVFTGKSVMSASSGSASMGSASGKSKTEQQKVQMHGRLLSFSRNIKIVAFFNFLFVLLFGLYSFNKGVNFETGSDAFVTWRSFFILTEVLLPLVQFLMLVVVLKVFQSSAEVVQSKQFQGIAIGIILLIGTLIICIVSDGEMDDADMIEEEEDV